MADPTTKPAQGLRSLVEALSPSTQLGGSWDSDLPRSASLQLSDGRALGAVRLLSGEYVLSVVDADRVQSALLRSWSREDVERAVEELQREPADAAPQPRVAAARSPSVAALASEEQLVLPQELRENPRRRIDQNRDPNAPPGFEDEHQIGPNAHAGPRIQFDPSKDLYPPGGPHPRLGLDPLDPRNAMDGRPPRGGMQPQPFGSGPRPFMRWDPPNPF